MKQQSQYFNSSLTGSTIMLPDYRPITSINKYISEYSNNNEQTSRSSSLNPSKSKKRAWDHNLTTNLRSLISNEMKDTKCSIYDINWTDIANKLDSHLSSVDCYLNYWNTPESIEPWSKEEELELLRLCQKYEEHNWHLISTELKTKRSPIECLKHYQRTLNINLFKYSNWSNDENIR